MPDCTPEGGSDQRQARCAEHHHAKGEDEPIVDTHWTSTIVAWRLAWSAGNATLTTVASMKVKLDPRDGGDKRPTVARGCRGHMRLALPSS